MSPVFRWGNQGLVIFGLSGKVSKFNVKVEHQEEKSNPFSLLIGDRQLSLVNELCDWFPLSWVFHVFTTPKGKTLPLGGHWPSCLKSELVLVMTNPHGHTWPMVMGRSSSLLLTWRSNPAGWGILPSMSFMFLFCKMETIGLPTSWVCFEGPMNW